MAEEHGITTSVSPEAAAEIEECLRNAREAYEADDSQTVADECRRVTELDPDNVEAWDLLAKFGGWDSKLYDYDADFIIEAIRHSLSLQPEGARIAAASEIYQARKRQVAALLDSAFLTPSYTGAKQLHAIMQWWLRLLQNIPYLTEDLLEGEITLCTNLCNRSRIGIMPADRLVYTAYKTFNGEPYGETFRKTLDRRIEAEREKDDALLGAARERSAALAEAVKAHLAENASTEQLEEDKAALQQEVDGFIGFTQRASYEKEMAEVDARIEKTPQYKFFKMKEFGARKAALQKKIDEGDAELEPDVKPLRDLIEAISARLNG